MALLASPLSLLLLALAAVIFFTGESWGAIVIAIMVVLSSLLTFVQEYRSDNAAEKLRSLVGTTVTVLRKNQPVTAHKSYQSAPGKSSPAEGAQKYELPLAQIVPGDVLFLSVGDIVPADVRVLNSKDLFVSRASLTGESLPVEKFSLAITAATTSALDLNNIAFMGTNVVSGTTTFGHIAAAIAGQRELTSFDRGINKFIWLIIRFMLIKRELR